MKKTFQLAVEGRHPDRVLDAIKHEVRKYLRRERRRALPAGVDFLDFDCRFGASAETAATVPLASLTALIDGAAREGASSFYLEILSKPGHRQARPVHAEGGAEPESGAAPAAPETA